MATVTAPTLSKQQFISWFGGLAALGMSAVTVFDPSIQITPSMKGFVASAGVAVAGWVFSVYTHSSHKKEIAQIAADAGKVASVVTTVVSPPA